MKRTYSFAVGVVILCAVTSALSQRHFGFPFPVTIGDKYSFMDSSCHLVVPAQYNQTMEFSEGLAAVKIGGKWGYIDQGGSLVIQPKFAGAWFFSEGLASVKLGEQSPLWGFIDRKGDVVIQPQFGMPLQFSEGLVQGYGEKNKILNIPLGYMDKTGRYVVRLDEAGFEIGFLLEFSDGLARVSMYPKHADGSIGPSKYGYIDHSGKWVIPRSFVAADDFHEGLAAVMGRDGTWGYIDKAGEFVIAPRFEAASEFSEGLAAVLIAGRWGWINKSGEVVIQPMLEAETLDDGSEFVEGMAHLEDRLGYKVINTSGNVICSFSAQ